VTAAVRFFFNSPRFDAAAALSHASSLSSAVAYYFLKILSTIIFYFITL
jgi:hypothetical protein